MNNRSQRARIAEQTVCILNSGVYLSPAGKSVNILQDLKYAVDNTKLYRPEDFSVESESRQSYQTLYEVSGETTFAAVRRLVAEEAENIACLNFASAKNPGGGFLGGSQAQEESLARASGLYPCLAVMDEYYSINRATKSCLYTDHMIYSPQVPIFRDDHDELLEEPVKAAIITAPAVNKGALSKSDQSSCNQVMGERIKKLLSLCAIEERRTLVLGAWGCGVFRNEPQDIAALFKKQLQSEEFAGVFERVVFAIYDNSKKQKAKRAFEENFI